MAYLNHNGDMLPAGHPIFPANNRWLKLGDAVYEQFRVFDGNMPFLADHVNQLELSVNQLGLEPGRYLTVPFFEKEINKLLAANECTDAAVTITVYRKGTGTDMLPLTNEAAFLIEARTLEPGGFAWNERGLKVALYEEVRQPQNRLAGLNLPFRMINVAAARFADQHDTDEALILNAAGRPVMFSGGALLVLHEGKLKFPVFSEGAPPSILRESLLPMANRMNIDYQPEEITLPILEASEEIMHIHPVKGVQFVRAYNLKRYRSNLAKDLFEQLSGFIR